MCQTGKMRGGMAASSSTQRGHAVDRELATVESSERASGTVAATGKDTASGVQSKVCSICPCALSHNCPVNLHSA